MLHAKKISRNNLVTIFFFCLLQLEILPDINLGLDLEAERFSFMSVQISILSNSWKTNFIRSEDVFVTIFLRLLEYLEELKKENTIPNLEMFSVPGFVFYLYIFFYCPHIFIIFCFFPYSHTTHFADCFTANNQSIVDFS